MILEHKLPACGTDLLQSDVVDDIGDGSEDRLPVQRDIQDERRRRRELPQPVDEPGSEFEGTLTKVGLEKEVVAWVEGRANAYDRQICL